MRTLKHSEVLTLDLELWKEYQDAIEESQKLNLFKKKLTEFILSKDLAILLSWPYSYNGERGTVDDIRLQPEDIDFEKHKMTFVVDVFYLGGCRDYKNNPEDEEVEVSFSINEYKREFILTIEEIERDPDQI